MKNITLRKEDREKLQKLANIDRYNNAIKIHHESVAEHSFFVAIYVDIISNMLNLDYQEKYKILYLALTHDIAEIEISDVPHNVKESNPEIKIALEKAESTFNKKYVYDEYVLDEQQLNLRKFVVEVADILSVIQYAETEVEIGNSNFNEIYIAARKRYSILIQNARKENIISNQQYEIMHGYSTNTSIERKVGL